MSRGGRNRLIGLIGLIGLVVAVGMMPGSALAQEPIRDNDFAVDVVGTPVLGSSRVIGMSGAFTALAQGVSGVTFNPAGYATRAPWELERFEWELGASIQFPGAFSTADYFLNGQGDGLGVDSFFALQLSGRLQFADLGVGVAFDYSSFQLEDSSASVDLSTLRFGAGYAFLRGQLVLGVGARAITLDVTDADTVQTLVSFTGFGAEVGATLRLDDQPWRAALAVRSPVSATIVPDLDAGAPPSQVAGYTLPESVRSPWEISAGFAYQLLERPLNHRFVRPKSPGAGIQRRIRREACAREREQAQRENPGADVGQCPRLSVRPQDARWRQAEAERVREERQLADSEIEMLQDEVLEFWEAMYESLPRRYVLISADVLLMGQTARGVGLDAFVRQERRSRGESLSFGFRLGVESEVWAHRLKLRGGTYLEPARYAGVRYRTHGTAGFDLRLFRLFGIEWQVGMVADIARDYLNWGFSVGTWH